MRYYVIINGVNSLAKNGLAIKELPPISKPSIRTNTETIDGRDGDIVTRLGYGAYDKTIEIGLFGNYDIDDIISYDISQKRRNFSSFKKIREKTDFFEEISRRFSEEMSFDEDIDLKYLIK